MSHYLLLVIHLICAAIWVGGHLLLSIRYLPRALKEENPKIITDFESQYEIVGLPALLLLVVSGIWMSYKYGVTATDWFGFSNPIETVISIKLILLFTTLLLAIHARLFIIPRISSEKLNLMAAHIIAITIVGVLMLAVGASIRFGGLL
jgi:putative copper export protein